MCYTRGAPGDYDEWAAATRDPRWSWHALLPVFREAEDNTRGADAWHGTGGPLAVSDLRHHNELSDAVIEAAAAAGFARNRDFNAATQEGFGLYQVTQKDGARCSAASAYLAPVRHRKNLRVQTHALTTRVRCDGKRAVGVDYRHRGRDIRVEAGCVLLAGGAINSPQLLMLSGIGPADHLREHGIAAVHDLRGVGGNLQDHLDICTLARSTKPVTYDRTNDVAVALEFLARRSGIGTSNIAEAGGFVRSRFATDARCDLQFHFVPALLDDHGRNRLPGYGYTLHACGLRPRSRGTIRLKTANPTDAPAIQPNYLSDAQGDDLKVLVEAAKRSREIFAAAPFDAYRGDEIFPGCSTCTDADLAAFIRRKAETIYHPIGTCRMGSDDDAVVDAELRVRGVAGLRVVDASVMPTLPGGNTNAPTIMIAERGADFISAA